MKCEDCDIDDDTVIETTCPFSEEIYDTRVDCQVCPNCYNERSWEV